ncbi:MAG: 6,7-dimethyl-8-ribityllumazine synthase [Lutibacter sp.]|nr:6,7-dimethyl-8-ribityllumazine synthase [Lutibacter sp.]
MATTNLSAYEKNAVPSAKGVRFGLVVSEWNADITENLFKGAHQTLLENGALPQDILRWNVPGSFELIYGCKKMIQTEQLDAIIAIGNVIQGETKHFDFVCEGVTQGIKDLNLQYELPVIFCVLTDQHKQQSIDRSGGRLGNKGVESAIAAIKMAALNAS